MQFPILLSAMLAVVFAKDHNTFIDPNHFADYLRNIESSHEFRDFTMDEKNMFSNMILAAEKGSADLTAFIEKVHFENILTLIRRLDEDDIPIIERYLGLHLTTQQGTSNKKRQAPVDLSQWMNEVHMIYKIEDHMPNFEKMLFREMMYAADHNQLTKFIDEKGYGVVFMIMSYVDHDYSDKLDDLVVKHLAMEAAMGIHHQHPNTTEATSPHTK